MAGQGRIVLAIEALIRTGTKPGKAEQEIADQLGPKVHVFAGKRAAQTATGAILRNWRKAFGAKRVQDMDAQILFDEGVTRIKRLILGGDRASVLAITQNVEQAAAHGGVLSPPISHQ
jgi:hypothetical protein